jgi:hypothetical protein
VTGDFVQPNAKTALVRQAAGGYFSVPFPMRPSVDGLPALAVVNDLRSIDRSFRETLPFKVPRWTVLFFVRSLRDL